jgi:membrane-associated phospholipid phosphatase
MKNQLPKAKIQMGVKILYFLISLGLLIVLYYGVSYVTPFKVIELPVTFIDRGIHFHIGFAYVYISFYLLFLISIAGNKKNYSLRCAITVVTNTLIASCIFFFFPTRMPAAIYTSEEHTHYFLSRFVQSLDVQTNCFPSLHIANAFIAAYYLTLERKLFVKWIVWTWFILICWSVISTGQHYFYDIIGGIILAMISLFIIRKPGQHPDIVPEN